MGKRSLSKNRNNPRYKAAKPKQKRSDNPGLDMRSYLPSWPDRFSISMLLHKGWLIICVTVITGKSLFELELTGHQRSSSSAGALLDRVPVDGDDRGGDALLIIAFH